MTVGKVRVEEADRNTSWTQKDNGQLFKVHPFPESWIPPRIQEEFNVTSFQDSATCV